MKQHIKNAAYWVAFVAITCGIFTMDYEDEVLRERAKACESVRNNADNFQYCMRGVKNDQ